MRPGQNHPRHPRYGLCHTAITNPDYTLQRATRGVFGIITL
jgi:hypothetical protein